MVMRQWKKYWQDGDEKNLGKLFQKFTECVTIEEYINYCWRKLCKDMNWLPHAILDLRQ